MKSIIKNWRRFLCEVWDKKTAWDILERAERMGFKGAGGQCAGAAMAMNAVLFSDQAKLIATVNKHLWENENRMVGHVALETPDGAIWDAEGEMEMDDFVEWAMLDIEDPDYNLPNEEAATKVLKIYPTKEQLIKHFNKCDISLGEKIQILKKAAE